MGADPTTEDLVAATRDFFAAFFDPVTHQEDVPWFTVWTLSEDGSSKRTWWFQTTEQGFFEAAVVAHSAEAQKCNVYFSVGVGAERRLDHERLRKHDVTALCAVWADIDFAATAHAKIGLPPTIEEAYKVLRAIPLDPSVVVESGHGLQAFWFLKEPFGSSSLSPDELEAAERLTFNWHSLLVTVASQQQYFVDPVQDLSRLMRVPYTWNRKAAPVRVSVPRFDPSVRYDAGEIDDCFVGRDIAVLSPMHPKKRERMLRASVDAVGFNTDGLKVSRERVIGLSKDPESLAILKDVTEFLSDQASASDMDWHVGLALARHLGDRAISEQTSFDWQQVLDLMALNRFLSNPQDIKTWRTDYWLRTIGKMIEDGIATSSSVDFSGLLRHGLGVDSAPGMIEDSLIQQESDEMILASVEVGTAKMDLAGGGLTSEVRRTQLAKIGEILGIEIVEFIRFPADTGGSYRLIVKGGTAIRFDCYDEVESQQRFGRRIADATKVVITELPKKDWLKLLAGLIRCSVDMTLGEDSSDEIRGRRFLKRYFERFPPVQYVEGMPITEAACLRLSAGRIGMDADRLIKFKGILLDGFRGDSRRIAEMVRAAGAIPEDLRFETLTGSGAQTQQFWVIPEYLLRQT